MTENPCWGMACLTNVLVILTLLLCLGGGHAWRTSTWEKYSKKGRNPKVLYLQTSPQRDDKYIQNSFTNFETLRECTFCLQNLNLTSHALRPMYFFQMINLLCNGDSSIGLRFYISVNIQDVAYYLNVWTEANIFMILTLILLLLMW